VAGRASEVFDILALYKSDYYYYYYYYYYTYLSATVLFQEIHPNPD